MAGISALSVASGIKPDCGLDNHNWRYGSRYRVCGNCGRMDRF